MANYTYNPDDPLGSKARSVGNASPKKSKPVGPRLNKNVLFYGLGLAAMKYDLDSRSLKLLRLVLWEAQQNGSRRVVFTSWRTLIGALGWQSRWADDYTSLRKEARRLKKVELCCRKWHHPGGDKEPNVRFRLFDVVRVTFSGIVFRFSEDFWRHHDARARHYFVIWTDKAANHRTVAAMILALYWRAWDKPHERNMLAFAETLGIRFHSIGVTRSRVRKAIQDWQQHRSERSVPAFRVDAEIVTYLGRGGFVR